VRDPGCGGDERHRSREAALQMLYAWEVGRVDLEDLAEAFWSEHGAALGLSVRCRAFADRLARGTVAHVGTIDPLIADRAEHWRLSRLALIDRLILRVAVYELQYEPDTPPAVVIDEALELARTFSGEEAVRFVNGVLDGIRKHLTAE
jgi:N utilization substance protein B